MGRVRVAGLGSRPVAACSWRALEGSMVKAVSRKSRSTECNLNDSRT